MSESHDIGREECSELGRWMNGKKATNLWIDHRFNPNTSTESKHFISAGWKVIHESSEKLKMQSNSKAGFSSARFARWTQRSSTFHACLALKSPDLENYFETLIMLLKIILSRCVTNFVSQNGISISSQYLVVGMTTEDDATMNRISWGWSIYFG